MADYTHTILFVDDEQAILNSLKRLFRKKGIEILTASDGSEGLLRLSRAEKPVSLIISDQQMPQMTGTQFLEQSKKIAPDAIRFLLTGYSDIQSTIDSINQGEVNRYLTKPWSDIELMHHVDLALNEYELKMENRRLLQVTLKQNQQLFEFGKTIDRKVRERSNELRKKNKELEANIFNSVRAFATLADTAIPSLEGHGSRVSRLSAEIAKKMGLNKDEVLNIEIAGLLHDIGKVGLPQPVANYYCGKGLKSDLKKQFRLHPEKGQVLLSFSDKLNRVGLYIRHHHERYDGQGFPEGLSEKRIPLGSRIIAITDAYDWISNMQTNVSMYHKKFLASKKVTQDHLSQEEIASEAAIYHIKKNAFTQFDPDIIKYIINMQEIKTGSVQKEKKHNIYDLKEGMVLARPLYNKQGHLLIPHSVTLTTDIIETLKKKQAIGDIAPAIFILA